MIQTLHRFLTFLSVALLAAGTTGCYPDQSAGISELDIVMTNYDTNFLFSGVHTYMMPDTVVAITDPDHPDKNTDGNHAYDSVILSEMAARLNDLGYVRLYDTLVQKPEIGIVLNTSATLYWGAFWNEWDYYWGWYSYWPYYYEDGWEYYYPWDITYNYTVGTLLVQMIDLKSGPALSHDSVSVVWTGAVNGLVEGSDVPSRIKKGIDQLFIQSPYL